LASPTRRAPYWCEPGQPGIERNLELELKLLADVGIIGLPNAGKSTLLSLLTAAKPKIADYPFSTLEPGLGVLPKPEGGGYVLADIPGLIEGASQGAGLGHKFLRHIERTRLLLHLVDAGSGDPFKDIDLINEELHQYSERLQKLPQILLLNKSDLVEDQDREILVGRIKSRFPDQPVMLISCATRRGVDELKNLLYERLSQMPQPEPSPDVEPDERATDHGDSGWHVIRQKKMFTVVGDRIDRLAQVTDLRSPESLHHFYNILRAMGVFEELIKQGAQPGSEVIIGGLIFTYGEGMG
jgi:GTP-binding protein